MACCWGSSHVAPNSRDIASITTSSVTAIPQKASLYTMGFTASSFRGMTVTSICVRTGALSLARRRRSHVRFPVLRTTAIRAVLVTALVTSIGLHAWDLSTPGLLDRTGRLKEPDFLQFYTYGALVDAGRSADLYDPAAHALAARTHVDPRLAFDDFHPNYSPIVAWLMAPLAALPFLTAMAVWTGISALLYAASIVIVRRLARTARSDGLTPALAAAAWPAFFMTLRYGQISTVALFALAVALWLDVRDRHFAAGLVLGCLVYKPTLVAVPVLVFLAAGQWSLLAGVAAAAGAETLVAVWLVGAGPFDQYVHILVSLAAAPDTIQLFPAESHSTRGFVRLLAPFEPAVRIATALGLVGAVAAAAWVWRSLDDRRLRWAALTLAMAAGSPHLLTYDLVLLAVPLTLVYDWLASDPRPDPVEFWALALALLYASAWPGVLIARATRVQVSTLGMVLALGLLVAYSWRVTRSAAGSLSSSRPSISS